MFLKQNDLITKVTKEISKIDIDFSSQKEQLKQQFKQLYAIANQTDKSFNGAVSAQEKKQIKGLEALEKRLLKAEKKVHKDYIERLESIHLELFPSGGLQERFTNFSEFYAQYGSQLLHTLQKELDPLKNGFSIISL